MAEYKSWEKHICQLVDMNNKSDNYEQKSQYAMEVIQYVLNNKFWIHEDKYAIIYQLCFEKLETLYNNEKCPKKYIPQIDKIIVDEYIFAHGGTQHTNKIWEIIKSQRHLFVRCIDTKNISKYLIDDLTNIVVDYMV